MEDLLHGDERMRLDEFLQSDDEVEFGQRFRLAHKRAESALLIYISESSPLEAVSSQRLFDLVEALPKGLSRISISFAPDYVIQSQDVRWLVDTLNLCSARSAKLHLVVGSSRNHDTLIRLGLDQHLQLDLELERDSSRDLDEALNESEGIGQPPTPHAEELLAMDSLSPARRSLVEQLQAHIENGEFEEGVVIWKRQDRNEAEVISALNDHAWAALDSTKQACKPMVMEIPIGPTNSLTCSLTSMHLAMKAIMARD